MLSKAAKAGDQSPQMEAHWTLGTQPCSTEEDEQALVASLSYSSLQYGSQQLQLAITQSDAWTPSDLAQLETLIQSRNRFVCMQLLTMAKEQYDKVKAAKAAGDQAVLHSARFMFLATITLTGTNNVVAAGLFYPRLNSKDQVEMPHMYVELLCCNSPGKGYGTVLLQHIEQFTAGCCDYISAGLFKSLGPTGVSSSGSSSSSQVSSSSAVAVDGSHGILLPLVATNAAAPADGLSAGCCSACNSSCGLTIDAADSATSSLRSPATATAAGKSREAVATATALDGQLVLCSGLHSPAEPVDIPQPAATTPSAYDAAAVKNSGSLGSSSSGSRTSSDCPMKRIQGIKLLSIGSAQTFYERNGYRAPDVCKEMFKPLMSCSKRAGLGDGSSAAGSSCSSIAMSIC